MITFGKLQPNPKMKYFTVLLFSFINYAAFGQSDTLEIELNIPAVISTLNSTPHEINVGIGQISQSQQIIYLPYKNGESKAFKLIAYDIVPVQLRKSIKTYYGKMVDDPSVDCRVTLANGEISVSIVSASETIAIEKNIRSVNSDAYWVYEVDLTLPECEVEQQIKEKIDSPPAGNTLLFNSHGTQLRTYDLALLVTNEFYTAGGGTDATVNAYVASIVNNINGMYEKEIAVRFTLVSPNNPVSTNVFSVYGTSVDLSAINTELNNRFGTNNFDIGHCLLPSGGGVAQLSVVCASSKGRARSGVSAPANILVFAHELGHQFGAGHTFNGNDSGSCGPGNRMNNYAYEPGSGNTVMSYANLCSPSSFNITGGKVPYFHTHSQENMINHILNRPAGCGTTTNTNNAIPVVTIGNTITIPKNTPFTLTGSATDGDSDPLTYTWEQYNLATVADVGRLGNTANASGISAVNSTTAPLFRSRQLATGTRNFPDVSYVLGDSNNPADNIGEDLPNVSRTMNFRLTARDNKAGGGGVAFKELVVNVADSGPFEVTTGNSPTLWFQGENINIEWAVNGTNAAPINAANVKISFSTDGGATFSTVIAASTPNDGSFMYSVPTISTTQARIKIEAIGKAFYDINNENIVINNGVCTPEVSNLINSTQITSGIGNANLSFDQGAYSTELTTSSGEITADSPASTLIFKDFEGNCSGPFSNSPQHQTITFIAVNGGNTTFTFPNGVGSLPSKTFNLYIDSYNPANQCQNWVNSSATRATESSSISLSRTLTQNLQAGRTYELRVSGFSTGNRGTFTVAVSGNSVYNTVPTKNSPYAYTYLIYNTATGKIEAFQTKPDLTAFVSGNYRLYGLSYKGGLNLAPYVNTSFANFQTLIANSSVCGKLSNNFRNVNITGPCPPSLSLVSPANNIASGTIKQEVSGTITATNKITGGNVRYDAGRHILLNPGFSVNSGVIFSAYIDGCGGQ